MTSEERRRWERLEQELRIRLDLLEPAAGANVTAIATHLSPEGIFVMLSDPPAPGSRVRVCLDSDSGDPVLRVEGKVVRQEAPDDTKQGLPGIGILLEEPGPAWTKLYTLLLGPGH